MVVQLNTTHLQAMYTLLSFVKRNIVGAVHPNNVLMKLVRKIQNVP